MRHEIIPFVFEGNREDQQSLQHLLGLVLSTFKRNCFPSLYKMLLYSQLYEFLLIFAFKLIKRACEVLLSVREKNIRFLLNV